MTGTAKPQGLAARKAAMEAIAGVLDRGRMLEEAKFSGTPAERAEALGLADLTLRRLGQIDAVLTEMVPRPPPAPAIHALRLMAAELLFAGRAAHAAVDSAVRLTRGSKAARLSGLVNAVGRRLATEGADMMARQDVAGLNAPLWLSARLSIDWGVDTAMRIGEVHLSPAPHDLTLANPADGPALAKEVDGEVLPTGSLRLNGRPQISALPGYAEGAWWAQDAAAALPAGLIPAPEGKRVLDLCAAPGGKTMQLAAMGAEVTALDISKRRMERLKRNLARTGLAADCVVADAFHWTPPAPFDAILLDAPCSATGTVRRHPDLPHRFNMSALDDLKPLQAGLLDRAWTWLRPGGILVYCTCSLFKSEGEDQAAAFLERAADAAPDPVDGPFADPDGWLRTRPDMWPEHGGLDGFFAARFAKRDN